MHVVCLHTYSCMQGLEMNETKIYAREECWCNSVVLIQKKPESMSQIVSTPFLATQKEDEVQRQDHVQAIDLL